MGRSSRSAAVHAQGQPRAAATPPAGRHLPISHEQGEIGPELFRHACLMGLEGLVSKRSDRPYRGGRSKDWIKVKNRKHPAMERVMEAFK
jgi:ATP-dependent DNA ligase